MLKPLFIVLVLLFSLRLLGQHPYYYKIDDEAGLPSNEVYELLQDDFGYVWIGCDAGLFRYDGFRFKGYTNPKQNGKSISYLRKDKKGRIWCKNFNGQIYRAEGDSLRIIIDNSGLESTASQFTLDNEGNLWVANHNIIEQYDENGHGKKQIYKEEPSGNISHFLEIIYFNNAVYFTKSGSGLYRFDLNTKQTRFMSSKYEKQHPFSRFNFSICKNELFLLAEEVQKGYALFEVTDSLNIINWYDVSTISSRFYHARYDEKGLPWICTSSGVTRFRFEGKEEKNYTLFEGEKISYMMRDREGDYWFSSLHNGIFVVPSLSLMQNTIQNAGLPTNNLSAVACLNDKSLLVGTYSGELLQRKQKFEPLAVKFPGNYGTVKKIVETEKYIFISRIFLTVIDKKTNKEIEGVKLNARDFIVFNDSVYSISYGALHSVALKDVITSKAHAEKSLRKIGGKAVYCDPETRMIYVAFNDGLFSYKNGKFDEVKYAGDHIYVQQIAPCENEALLITSNKGVLKLSKGNVASSGLGASGINESDVKVICCKEGKYFISTNSLFYIYDVKHQKTAHYSAISGINSKDITAIDYTMGSVYLATNKGLITFPVDLDCYNKIRPSISIENIQIGDSLLPKDSVISLSYLNNNLRVNFSSVAFRSRGTFYYEYRLKELDSIWVQTKGSENYAVFSSVPPGDYTFEVRAINESGVSSLQNASLVIHVDAPFWQKWWFYVIVVILTAGIVAFVFQLRIKVIRKQAAIKQDITSSQLAAINAQMNPHFMYNTLNSIQDLILKSDIKNTNYYLSRFSTLMRKILEASQHNTILLDEEIEILELYLSLEKLRFGNEFNYQVNCSDDIDTTRISIPSIIIQPFVENAIKHGLLHKKGEKQIIISFAIKENTLICQIADNGIGRKRAAEIKERSPIQHRSFATQATEQRLILMNSVREKSIDLRIIDLEENGEAKGTEVRLRIPL